MLRRSLKIGDRILAIDGIVFDQQTLDIINQDVQLIDHRTRSVSIAVTTFYEIMASILDLWVNNQYRSSRVDDGFVPRRKSIQVIIARSVSYETVVSPVPDPEGIREPKRTSESSSLKEQLKRSESQPQQQHQRQRSVSANPLAPLRGKKPRLPSGPKFPR